MTFSTLDSALTGPLFATDAMRAVFSDRARLAALLNVEAALARAEAKHGLVPKALAGAIAKVSPDDLDIAALGRSAAQAGVITIPFVKAVEGKLPEALRGYFHRGATSQDILDTATVLQMRDGLDLIEADLAAIMAGLARLARAHRRTPMVGRSYGQHAAPITFGFAVATWLSGIAEVGAGYPGVRERVLTASLGGPVGTLAAIGDRGPAVADTFATELGLGAPSIAWHATRARMAGTGAWLAMLIGALAKMATDVVHLSSTEVGEVAEPHSPDRGGSSAMPHKRNPISSTIILAAHGVAAGHAAALIGAMAAADQRPAGAWHAEWHALPPLFGLASGALREARALAEGLVVDKARMRANLDLTRGLLFSDAVAAALALRLGRETAHAIVAEAADTVRRTSTSLQTALANDPAIPAALQKAVEAAFDLGPSIDAAAMMTERALAALKRNKKKR
jgi:3-carboxy-cis,cis-muconate cycloisomerase